MKLIILDRDGVINEDADDYIRSAADWRPIEGSLEAIVRLKHADYRIVIASNQSGIGRGLFDYGALFAMHDKMTRMLADLGTHIDGLFFCPHAPEAGCDCRKPAPGLLEAISRRTGQSLADVPFVGDSVSDIQAAHAVGARPILVDTGKGANLGAQETQSVARYPNLWAAVDGLLRKPV